MNSDKQKCVEKYGRLTAYADLAGELTRFANLYDDAEDRLEAWDEIEREFINSRRKAILDLQDLYVEKIVELVVELRDEKYSNDVCNTLMDFIAQNLKKVREQKGAQ